MDIFYYKNFFPDWILAGTTTREFGDVSIRDKTNKERLAEILHIPKNRLVSLKQEHATVIKEIYIDRLPLQGKRGNDRRKETGDGLFTKEKNICLLIKTADCLPILIVETQQRIIAAFHAGRVGTLAHIAQKGIEKIKKLNGNPKFIRVIFGPCIERKCYTMDLVDLNKNQLIKSGVLKENILINQECTYCHTDNYYSYRRGDKQRMVNFIMMI